MWLLIGLSGCSSPKSAGEQGGPDGGRVVPTVTDQRADLLFTWFADGGVQMAGSIADIPNEARGVVRVQDPTIPPEKRDPQQVFLVDLTAPDATGHYGVKTVTRAVYEAKHLPKPPSPPPPSGDDQAGEGGLTPVTGASQVTMYSTRHCPVCVKARRWLVKNQIPFIEKDIEKDPQGAAELNRKAQAQGLRPSGVPVFDVSGQLLMGFDPMALKALLTKAPRSI